MNLMQRQKFSRLPLNIGDDTLSVYDDGVYIYRYANNESAALIKSLFDSGLIDFFLKEGLIPLTELIAADDELCVRQEKISPITYPFEWSPEMLRDAARLVILVNKTANRYGFQLKDAHPYNIVFKGARPLFVDIGSFIRANKPQFWIAEKEFVQCYCYTLSLAARGLFNIYTHAFAFNGNSFKGEHFVFSYPLLSKIIGWRFLLRLRTLLWWYKKSAISERAYKMFQRLPFSLFFTFVIDSNLLPFRKTNYRRLEGKINAYAFDHYSVWGDYHERSGYCSGNGEINLTERFGWVISKVVELNVATVIEIGGNQGVLSRALSNIPSVSRVICSDYDLNALDALYRKIRNVDLKIYPCYFDFMGDVRDALCANRFHRFKSDLVLALAVTHHLILGQRYSLDEIMRRLSILTNKYLIVEFMPLGLWDGNSKPHVPQWYHQEWFESVLKSYFHVLDVRQLEINRIAYLAKIR